MSTFGVPSTQSGDPLCDSCRNQDLRHLLFRSYSETALRIREARNFFTIAEFWKSSQYCSFCMFLRAAFERSEQYRSICALREPDIVCDVSSHAFASIDSNYSSIATVTRQIRMRLRRNISPNPENEYRQSVDTLALYVNSGAPKGMRWPSVRQVDRTRFDVRLVSLWLKVCEKSHSTHCQPRPWPTRNFVLRVVDVRHRCIVKAPANCSYVALSYTWGDPSKVSHLKLGQQSTAWLHSRGALRDNNPFIPRTIRDAIQICDDIGESYLWVDALCIEQDNEYDQAQQIPAMDGIYTSAKLTIVAGCGSDAWAGLPGAGTNPVPRRNTQLCHKVQGIEFVLANNSYRDWLLKCFWNTRAWTYQEKWCSKRLLIFTEEQVFFHCASALWYEDLAFEDFDVDGGKILELEKSNQKLFLEPFDAYADVVNGFVQRSISSESDVLRAFRGLENYLAPSLGPQFVYGLPVATFGVAICWGFPQEAKRRMEFPSWSWAGWNFSQRFNKDLKRDIFSLDGKIRLLSFGDRGTNPDTGIVPSVSWRIYSEKSQAYVLISSLYEHDSLVNREPNYHTQHIDNYRASVTYKPSLSQRLQFSTSIVDCQIDQQGKNFDNFSKVSRPVRLTYSISNDEGREIAALLLLEEERHYLGNNYEFCQLGTSASFTDSVGTKLGAGIYGILIQWKDDLAFRVSTQIVFISDERWNLCRKCNKLITLV